MLGAILASAGLLNGCSAPFLYLRQDGNELIFSAPAALETNSQKLEMAACIAPATSAANDWASEITTLSKNIFAEATFYRGDSTCDVIIRVSQQGRNWSIKSDLSKSELFSISRTIGGDENNLGARILAVIYNKLKASTPAGQQIARERKTRSRSAFASENLEQLVKRMVGGQQISRTFAATEIEEPPYKLPQNEDNFALVVGIEKYPDLPEAQFAERDAESVRNHLYALGFPVRAVSPKSRVFIYFSGHGAPDVKTGAAYIVPWDGDANFLETTASPLKRMYRKLSELKAKEIIIALDACFSGTGSRSLLPSGMRPLVGKIDVAESQIANLVIFSAAAANEASSSLESKGHGAFTYFFLKGLSGEAADKYGHLTASQLHQYLTPKVQDEARRMNRDQTPQLAGSPNLNS